MHLPTVVKYWAEMVLAVLALPSTFKHIAVGVLAGALELGGQKNLVALNKPCGTCAASQNFKGLG